MVRLHVSDNNRFLVREDESPFFYLADTAWELFHRLSFEEATHYLRTRAAQGFTAVQAVALGELDGLCTPNANGQVPFEELDPTRPNEAYWQDVDRVVEKANGLGLLIGFLPTWGDKVVDTKVGTGPHVLNPDNAFAYGAFLGHRYRDADLIWINGGDRSPVTDRQYETYRRLAAGLRAGDKGAHLITYHPSGRVSSANYWHDEPWLDFNMMQSGHSRFADNYAMVETDYGIEPTKPVLDGEPAYEDMPHALRDTSYYITAHDVRCRAYHALFAGAFGHTYGCNAVWQMYAAGREPHIHPRHTWRESLELPGAGQMRHVRALIESRLMLSRVPDQALIASDPGVSPEHVRATSGENRTYAFVFFPVRKRVAIDLGQMNGRKVDTHWYDTRTGKLQDRWTHFATGTREFFPPSDDDWVLTIEVV